MSSLSADLNNKIAAALLHLDAWFQTMRCNGGYAGPISHWWESSLLYCGPMADWRYEGLICSYVNLYRKTEHQLWLDRALQAGDDLVHAQLPSGKYFNSSFQQGPMEGGTPHEAAVDVGLLELAQLLREMGEAKWRPYFETAERNIQGYLVGQLWKGEGFLDQPWNRTLVPNKNATVIEALVLYEKLSGRDQSQRIDAAINVILTAQEKEGPRKGGFVHRGTGRHKLAIGIYNARSICGLLRAYEREPCDDLLEACALSLGFLRGLLGPHGPAFGRYPQGEYIANPRMVAGSGDLLRAFLWARKFGLAGRDDLAYLVDLLLEYQMPSGAVKTALGFQKRGAVRSHTGLPEFRDLLPAVGWCDKAFRALAEMAQPDAAPDPAIKSGRVELECNWKGKRRLYQEDSKTISLFDTARNRPIYFWEKGSLYPAVYSL